MFVKKGFWLSFLSADPEASSNSRQVSSKPGEIFSAALCFQKLLLQLSFAH